MIIDINCDVGEGVLYEHLLMPYISSCNVACGGHFGNAKTINKTLKLATEHNVKIGAHPSFPDQENFGRKLINISNEALAQSIKSQMDLFLNCLSEYNAKIHHIKPHGALYNQIAIDKDLAQFFIDCIKEYMTDIFLYVPFHSEIESIAVKNNIHIKYEVFADRNYNDDLKLVERSASNAMILDKNDVLQHILSMVKHQKVKTISGRELAIKADTLCVHGDTKNASEIVKFINDSLIKEGVRIGF